MDQTALACRNEERLSSFVAPSSHPAEDALLHERETPFFPSLKKKGRLALLWSVGSTVLSALGFIAFALFEQYNSSLSELRTDLKHFNETSSSFVQKESYQRHREQLKERFKEVQAASTIRAQLEQELRTSVKAREEMALELQRLRERLAFIEGQQTGSPSVPRPNPVKK